MLKIIIKKLFNFTVFNHLTPKHLEFFAKKNTVNIIIIKFTTYIFVVAKLFFNL